MTTTTIYRQHLTADEVHGYFVVVAHDGQADCTTGKWCATLEAAQAAAKALTSGKVQIKDTSPWC